MTISMKCGGCHASLKAKDEYAGRRIPCPKCGTEVVVPQAGTDGAAAVEPSERAARSQAVASESAADGSLPRRSDRLPSDPSARYQQLETEAIQAIKGSIEPVRVPVAYRLGILLVMVVMVILPMIYLGLIAAAGYAVYWHAVSHTGLLTADLGATTGRNAGRARLMAAMIYVAPMIVGGIMVLFMFKPLLSRSSRNWRPRSLSRDKEPLLFAFVNRLCDAVHAPRPKRIDVDLRVNASASFRSGVLSMLGTDLVLTIGLPLVAGFNMRQFAGVLAHEFGHFAQGAGMRTTYLIRSISYWFERVVNERDVWDERLTQWSKDWDMRVSWILWLARGFVWLTRKILWCLMMVGHAVAGFMLRQMEFDADRHQARFSGSDTFAEAMNSLPGLSLAGQQSWNQLGYFYQEGRLVDDLPRLTVMNSRQLPADAREALARIESESKTGLFDTHPSGSDRIASSDQEDAPGIFRLKYPAAFLFRNFPALCKAATTDLYRELFGQQFDPATLASVDDLFAQRKAEDDDHAARKRFFQNCFTLYRPLAFANDAMSPPDNVPEAVATLKAARAKMEASFERIAGPLKSFQKARENYFDAQRVRPLLAAGIKIAPGAFELDLSRLSKVEKVEAEMQEQQDAVEDLLAGYDRIATRRITTALSLLAAPEIAARIENADELRGRVRRRLDVISVLASQFAPAISLLDQRAVMQMCLQLLNSNPQHEKATTLLRSTVREVVQVVRGMHTRLDLQRYPFDHAKSEISIARYILNELPDNEDLGGYFEASDTMSSSVLRMYSRTLGSLCLIAEHVETAIGLMPLPDPVDDEVEASEGQGEKG